MPAPDLGPPISHAPSARPLSVHLVPALVAPSLLVDSVVVMIDALRASVTIASALASGASAVHPTLTVEDAISLSKRMQSEGLARDRIVLGGERGGVLIPGFDLDNSPLAYTPERVQARTVIFTTANGTSTLLHAHGAARILIGALTNVSAVCRRIEADPREVHILCSGTRGEISLDDCLAAGAMVERLVAAGRELGSDDSGLVCLRLWQEAKKAGVLEAMGASRGGRNLGRLGFDADIRFCSTVDVLDVLPEYDPRTGRITLRRD